MGANEPIPPDPDTEVTLRYGAAYPPYPAQAPGQLNPPV